MAKESHLNVNKFQPRDFFKELSFRVSLRDDSARAFVMIVHVIRARDDSARAFVKRAVFTLVRRQ